jgi:hypothetical protein
MPDDVARFDEGTVGATGNVTERYCIIEIQVRIKTDNHHMCGRLYTVY